MSADELYETFDLGDADKQAIFHLLDVGYTYREPTAMGLHCTYDDLSSYYEYVVKAALESGASLGLRHNTTGDVVAIMLNYVISSPDAVIFTTGNYATQKSNTYAKIMIDLCEGINILRDTGAKKQLELLILTVHPDHAGKGLAKKLIQASEEKGKALGCDIATVQATNFITDIIFRKMEYQEILKVDIEKFKGEDGTTLLDLEAMGDTKHFTYLTKSI